MSQTITQHFQNDHERLDQLFLNFRTAKATDFDAAKRIFSEFKQGLQRHIVSEEDVLFPAWEQHTGVTGMGPTEVMRHEHRQIADALEQLHRKIEARDTETQREEQLLVDLLGQHNRKEELVLYPDLDNLLSEAERTAVFAEMERIPPQRYQTCCGQH